MQARSRNRKELHVIGVAPARITFKKLKAGVVVCRPFNALGLLNAYESFRSTLTDVRTLVIADRGQVSPKELKRNFSHTKLGKLASDENWREWIEIFRDGEAAPGGATLVFLERLTGLKRETIKVRCSAARKLRKQETKRV